nr:unnamed protein product [Rangifer tarandus platyrhynchus]
MQPPPPLARPARQGGVPSSPRRPAPASAPLPFFSSSRTWGAPGAPRLRARNSAPAAGTGRARDAPRAACSRHPRPTRRPAHFPRRRPTSPGGRPRAGRRRRRAGRDALCSRRCGRRSRRARRGRSRAGGGGRRRPRAAAAQPPRARAPIAHSHWSCSPTFPPSFFFRMEPATRARRRREETRSRSPARRHAPSCPPSPPHGRQHNKKPFTCEEVTLGRTARPRRRQPRGRRQKLGRRAALGARVRAPRRRRCAPAPGPRPSSPLAPHTPNSSLPTPRAAPAPARSDFLPLPPLPEAPGELSRLPGRAGSSAARCRGGYKTQSGLRSWLGGRGQGAGSSGAELAGGERGSGEFQGLRVPRPPPPRRSFV